MERLYRNLPGIIANSVSSTRLSEILVALKERNALAEGHLTAFQNFSVSLCRDYQPATAAHLLELLTDQSSTTWPNRPGSIIWRASRRGWRAITVRSASMFWNMNPGQGRNGLRFVDRKQLERIHSNALSEVFMEFDPLRT